ncbi:MAG: hypothetical protein STSR0001_06830 [Methanothrix sp.]
MSILKGYAVATGAPGADHTYVKCDNPAFSWPCWGRDSGGKEICSGSGYASVADCISQPSSHAGIIYAVTGVCHQTANRILFPAEEVVVSKAGGYSASVLLYGTYGTNLKEWIGRLKKCEDANAKRLSESPEIETPITSPESAYIQKVIGIYSKAERTDERFDITLLGKELQLMMEFRLGGILDLEEVDSATKLQANFLEIKHEMDQDFLGGKISIERYVHDANEGIGDFLRQLAEVLGKDQFYKVFGLAPPTGSFALIDLEIAKRAHSRK